MINRNINPQGKSFMLSVIAGFISMVLMAQPSEVSLHIDGTKKYQTIDGFGVNFNPAWWYNGEYGDPGVVQPAIDMLIDSLGATLFRAVIEEIDWEAVNDDNDPDNFNWAYFNSVFSNARFQGVWTTLRYLNQRGIAKGLIISFMGAPPASAPLAKHDPQKSWMGINNHVIDIAMEDELVESIAALLYYMRHIAKIEFYLVSPMNETDIIAGTKSAAHPDGIVEGPNMPDAVQYTRVIKKLAIKLDAISMSDIRFVAPDAASDRLFGECLNEIVKDSYLMSKMACWGVHQYGNDAVNYLNIISRPANTNKSFWVTETAGIGNMLGQLDDDASAYIYWDGYDCVYQHGIRNGYGVKPPNDWAFWFNSDEGKPLIEYIPLTRSWLPRKQFYEHAQLMRFIKPGAVRIGVAENDSNLVIHSFLNPDGQIVVVGRNNGSSIINIDGTLTGVPIVSSFEVYLTNMSLDLGRVTANTTVTTGKFNLSIPSGTTFTLAGLTSYRTEQPRSNNADNCQKQFTDSKPEPEGWYAGDIHIHRNCGEVTSVLAESELTSMMEPNDLAVISVLADMGNGEVKDSRLDLPKVTGTDASESIPGRIVHWDAEWHFDPAGVTFENKAIGGHLVFLGLKEAHQIWNESPYKIIEWGKAQDAVVGFCHMQYLTDSIPDELNCCIPLDFPVETALGTIDFLSEDVWLNDAAVKAYYKILNCGFRPGWAAGTDFPCNNSKPFGSLLTYVQVKDKPLTYLKWIEGIKNGRTVVTTNGHVEFLDFKINGDASPGDEIKIKRKSNLNLEVIWTASRNLNGRIELVCNGDVIASTEGKASPGVPLILKTGYIIRESSWICARRMDDTGHQSHTAPVYISVNDAPVRANADDARYFIRWIDSILLKIGEGGDWNKYFSDDIKSVEDRYLKAREIYRLIEIEANKYHAISQLN